jgi:glucuronate isomerase
MSETLRKIVRDELATIPLIDPHTHINPLAPASTSLADILGYHYYTELAHSAGLPRETIENPDLSPRERVGVLIESLGHLENTVQHSWLIDICQRFFGMTAPSLNLDNWEQVYDAAEQRFAAADWPDSVLGESNVEAVFLTNDFDDPLEGFDTSKYIPCLRTDELVFHLGKPETRERLEGASNHSITDLTTLREAIEQRFDHFVASGAKACAISLPPDFTPAPVTDGRAATALDAVMTGGTAADAAHVKALSHRIFWTLAELCDHHGLPFDLMIGVNRNVYPDGVHQGRDLYDSRVSLIQYRDLFNAFPDVKFPVSVLASVTNQELVSYAWIFPNVITSGHWWYSNTPSFISRDAAARLEAVPATKQIGYYSDAYKLEFIAPKFSMYRDSLARVLVDTFMLGRGWSESRVVDLGRQILRTNVDAIFGLD